MIYTRQRIAILRILYDATDPLTTMEIARLAGTDPHTATVNVGIFEGNGWACSEGDLPRRPGLTRRFTLTPRGRASIKTLLEQPDN